MARDRSMIEMLVMGRDRIHTQIEAERDRYQGLEGNDASKNTRVGQGSLGKDSEGVVRSTQTFVDRHDRHDRASRSPEMVARVRVALKHVCPHLCE
jgi:hypothetical protein